MIDRLEKLSHVRTCLLLSKGLILLLADLVIQRQACDHLHDQVDILVIIVRLVILHNVGVIERIQRLYLVHDVVQILLQLAFVQHLDCNVHVCVETICRLEHSTERACSKDFRLLVDDVVLFKLSNALLLESLACLQLLTSLFVLSWRLFKCCAWSPVDAAHFDNIFKIALFLDY